MSILLDSMFDSMWEDVILYSYSMLVLPLFGLSTKLSSTKDNILEGGDYSLNVIFNDSSTLWVFLLKTLWTLFILKKSKRYNIMRLSVTFDV